MELELLRKLVQIYLKVLVLKVRISLCVTAKELYTKGEKIFIQPKKNKGKVEAHITKGGESIRSISQLYGIKLKKLKKRNKHLSGYEIKSGFEIKLR